jgi:hypothetical protein
VIGKVLSTELKPEDGKIVQIWFHFVVEVDCNSGRHRRVYKDGRVEVID